MKKNYKYAIALTSQLAFCATPLRLDAYNRCQFGCGYCFASARQGHGRHGVLQVADPNVLRGRLERVANGDINSALDEFIERRIPFQLGGMSDPFSKIEEKERKTLGLIRVLNEFAYPFVVSTKGTLLGTGEYFDAIQAANSYVRFSTTVVSDAAKPDIDVGCPSLNSIAKCAETLSHAGVPVAFRLQPIIPGFEEEAWNIVDIAADCGVKHVSAEYLKVPLDANAGFGRGLKRLMAGNPIDHYVSLGAVKRGHEYILPAEHRMRQLLPIFKWTKSKGMSFGFADNDLLLHSDGATCCSASDRYLKSANFFDANIVSLGKKKRHNEKIFFEEFCAAWMPDNAVSTYLNSKSRIPIRYAEEPDWKTYLRRMWTGEHGLYSPDFFDGIEKTPDRDDLGLPVYKRVESDFESALASVRGSCTSGIQS